MVIAARIAQCGNLDTACQDDLTLNGCGNDFSQRRGDPVPRWGDRIPSQLAPCPGKKGIARASFEGRGRVSGARPGRSGRCAPLWSLGSRYYTSLDFTRWPAPGTASECAGLPTMVGRRREGGKKKGGRGRGPVPLGSSRVNDTPDANKQRTSRHRRQQERTAGYRTLLLGQHPTQHHPSLCRFPSRPRPGQDRLRSMR